MFTRDWLDEHLEGFVRPYLGKIPDVDPQNYHIRLLTLPNIRAIKAVWKEAKKKAKNRQILLAGRDVFLFEVLAKMEGFPTIFRPDISTCVAPNVTNNYKECYLLDTGYKGSVPKAMHIENYSLIRYIAYPTPTQADLNKWQIFPNVKRGPLVGLSGTLESVAKYWQRGTMKNGSIYQPLNPTPTFKEATMVTLHLSSFLLRRRKRVVVMSMGRGI